ncbi:FtsX-like permease family protein, partial [Candidatus Hodarchaeum mangrovi]
MIAGLVLGISILSGILLYSTVLMNNVYDTVIEGSPYEIRIDFRGNFNDSQLEGFKNNFKSNPQVLDAQLLYGNARTIVETTGTSTTMYTLANLEAEILVEYSNQTFSNAEGIVFSNTFLSSSDIGVRFKNKLLTSPDTGIYTNSSPYYHGVIISEDLVEKARIQQGNILKSITLAITQQDPENIFNKNTLSQITLSNVTVAGIISSDIGASAGIFSEALMFGTAGSIYVPQELLESQNKTVFLTDLRMNEMRYAVIKIDEDKFNLADPQQVNSQINRLINEIEKTNLVFIGTNLVEGQLLPFQILSLFIFIFDGVLTVPVAILSLYLLSFGVDLSLHERKYQVGILKTQGASPRQIKRKVLIETFILAISGLIIGYLVAIFAAWGIGTAKGFMRWDWDYALSELPDFFYFDQIAFFVVGGLIFVILLLMVNGKANTFIEMEITESVRRTEVKKQNFLRRNNLDLIFFTIGLLVLVLVIANDWFGYYINLGVVGGFLALLGPPLFWIGGAALVARLAVFIPPKADRVTRKIGFLKDINLLAKGNVFRKAGDMPRLALIIALTVSFSVLAAVQGNTGEFHKERLVTFEVGADLSVSTSLNFSSLIIQEFAASSDKIDNAMAIGVTSAMVFNDPVLLYTIDNQLYDTVGIWQSDSVPDSTPTDLINSLREDPNGVLLGKTVFREKALEIGESFTIEILTYHWNGSFINYDFIPHNVTVKGVFDHCPAGIGPSNIIIDHSLLNRVSNLTALAENLSSLPPFITALIPNFLKNQLNLFTNDSKGILASKYLIKTKPNADVKAIKSALLSPTNSWIISVKTLKEEIRQANEIENVDYGIPGLLTADFVISLLAATLATFIFMSILMEQRKREFAILRSYGASDRQIYKLVFSESAVLLLTSVIWGLIIGLGLSILFNGFFEFIDVFITPLSTLASGVTLKRLIIFDT